MSETIYTGDLKEITFPNGGSLLRGTLTLTGLAEIFKEHGFTTKNGVKKINIEIKRRREPSMYGDTHYIEVSTFKPDPNYKSNLNSGADTF